MSVSAICAGALPFWKGSEGKVKKIVISIKISPARRCGFRMTVSPCGKQRKSRSMADIRNNGRKETSIERFRTGYDPDPGYETEPDFYRKHVDEEEEGLLFDELY